MITVLLFILFRRQADHASFAGWRFQQHTDPPVGVSASRQSVSFDLIRLPGL